MAKTLLNYENDVAMALGYPAFSFADGYVSATILRCVQDCERDLSLRAPQLGLIATEVVTWTTATLGGGVANRATQTKADIDPVRGILYFGWNPSGQSSAQKTLKWMRPDKFYEKRAADGPFTSAATPDFYTVWANTPLSASTTANPVMEVYPPPPSSITGNEHTVSLHFFRVLDVMAGSADVSQLPITLETVLTQGSIAFALERIGNPEQTPRAQQARGAYESAIQALFMNLDIQAGTVRSQHSEMVRDSRFPWANPAEGQK